MAKRPGVSKWLNSRMKIYTVPVPASRKSYLSMLQLDLTGYLKVTAEAVEVDGVPALVWNSWTKGGRKGAVHVDTWAEFQPEEPREGLVALASARTPVNIWVDPGEDLERAGAVAIARASGVKYPLRFV